MEMYLNYMAWLTQATDCHVCRLVAKSNDKSPPHLHARPRLPVYPMGDWVSSSCETRPIGTFLMRRMKFTDHQNGKLFNLDEIPLLNFDLIKLSELDNDENFRIKWQIRWNRIDDLHIPGPLPLLRRSGLCQCDVDRAG